MLLQRVYQFIVDRLKDRRREPYSDGREAYETDRNAAHDLEKHSTEAVHADDLGTAEQLAQQHGGSVVRPPSPHQAPDEHQADPTAPGYPVVRWQFVLPGGVVAPMMALTPTVISARSTSWAGSATILLVDDVFTSGSQLQHVALRLRASVAADVRGLVLARVPWSG
ncbi:hypothetical protein M2164_000250 [Streptomyces sp. SAI-208]|uniref:hypothetical protein n=1 Tax=Streptomyces sp. SAI-208 TaxID=2940550 RepID=UPI002475597E|nr:hypothetical protein [Streptomyces sp. SAI-208]MDH6604615.1 hypothetical protein [Streptomyces sp. SAI-208]